ncbi:hypothetical protein T11_12194 [Trichinella zimbabwensis]|uniref:Uncharacterized protein n=1 Tax=Trichinella zimbabwensis TaxID=268475 RepID=A0A0V1G9J0_9BILA|nr:hypothetical protein T11_12194 [Trichinella zimbabwensis]
MRHSFTILTTILLRTSRYHWIAQIQEIKRVSLTCKFSCVALPFVCLATIQ